MLHANNPPKTAAIAEVEVESVAFIVCYALGLDTGDYSFAYVARWSAGSEDLIRATAGRAIHCAKSILGCLVATSEEDEVVDKVGEATEPPTLPGSTPPGPPG